MQDQNETILNFLKRTDDLATKLGVNVEDLTEIIGLSRASLFSYRTGKRKISSKAWSKLEASERKAGIKIRARSHPILKDVPIDEQPSDAALEAYNEEYLNRYPRKYHRKMIRMLSELARYKNPNDEEAAALELGENLKTYSKAICEAVRASANLYTDHLFPDGLDDEDEQ